MPLSNRMKTMMAGWGTTRNTKPLRNTLANRTASVLTKNQIMNILRYDPVLLNSVMRAIEHRAKNIQNENFRRFMVNYNRKRLRKRKNRN